MNPLHDYIVLQEIKKDDDVTSFKAEGDEQALCLGKIVAVSPYGQNDGMFFEDDDIGKKVLFKKYAFDEYKGQLIGKVENVIAFAEGDTY